MLVRQPSPLGCDRYAALGLTRFHDTGSSLVEQLSQVPLLWAYDYWRRMKPRREIQLHRDGWQTLDVPTQTKNALDEQLIRDCRRLGGQPFVNIVVLILGDKDFAHLAQWLISQHKRVIVIGRRNHISHKLRALVPNDVYEIEDL